MDWLSITMGLCMGVGLAAACGFRVFVPLLVLSIASKLGMIPLNENFAWVSSNYAIVGLSCATALEIGAYYVPWIDHALDSVATPAAVVAGTLAAATQMTHLSPSASWITGAIVGGLPALLTQLSTVGLRGVTTYTTAGLLNPLISTLEWVFAIVVAVLAIVIPVFLFVAFVIGAFFAVRWLLKRHTANTRRGPALA